MTETDPEKRLIGFACISTYGQMLDTQLSRAHLRRRRRSGIGRLTDPTASAQLWLRAGSPCPKPAVGSASRQGVSARRQRLVGYTKGRMFWFIWNRLSESYFVLISWSRR